MAEGDTPKVYSPKTLAERWECSEGHVRKLIERGELPAFRLGKLIRIRTVDVQTFENSETAPVEDVSELEPVKPKRRPPAPRLDTPIVRARLRNLRKGQ